MSKAYPLALLSAALSIILYPSLQWSFLAPIALVPLLVAICGEASWKRRFLLGWSAGIVYWWGVCYWIQAVLEVHGGMGFFGSWGAFVLFCLAKGVHLGVFATLAGYLLPRWYAIPSLAALWVAIERTHGNFGFAWLTLGDAAIGNSLLLRLAPWTGVLGLSFALMLINAAIAVLWLRRSSWREMAWLGLLLALPFLPSLPLSEPGRETAIAVQPNVPTDAEWTRESLVRLEKILAAKSLEQAQTPADIILWPEVPAPLYFDRDPQFRQEAENVARLAHTWFLFGTVARDSHGAPLNSAELLTPAGDVAGRYDKVNLVPFGEFIPPLFGWVSRITQEAGDFAPGTAVRTFSTNSHRIGTFICYESVFPAFVRGFTAQGANVLLNLSNDGYFGKSAARRQHLNLVRMRAVENRRWILRSTNDGYTVAIDPAGRITQSLEPYILTAGRLQFNYESARTFYTSAGDWFVALCAVIAASALVPAVLYRVR